MDALVEILVEAQRRGFLGPAPVATQRAHAEAFGAAVGPAPDGGAIAVDLGSGGGLPGLALAAEGPHGWAWVLVEANQRRARFLVASARALGVEITVLARRAEEVGRDPEWRGSAEVVVARAFGPPMVVAECAAPLLQVEGRLVVSEPPDRSDRWPPEALGRLGLGEAEAVGGAGEYGFARMVQRSVCPDRYPRRVGVPARRPLA